MPTPFEVRDLGGYLKDYRQRTSEIVQARVKSTPIGGKMTCVLVDTGAEVTVNVNQPVIVGQSVLLLNGDGSGRYRNARYVFLALGSSEGTSTTAVPLAQGHTRSNGTISSIPERVDLVAGGSHVPVLIYGTGFTAAPTYGNTNIVNHAAAVVTSTLITLQVKANVACPDGLYTITLAGVVIPGFFSVT